MREMEEIYQTNNNIPKPPTCGCGGDDWWWREVKAWRDHAWAMVGDWVCARCHPDPRASKSGSNTSLRTDSRLSAR